MKKIILSIGLTLISGLSFAQIPAGYYDTATGEGFTLKTQLHNIIKNINDQGYNGLRDLYKLSHNKNGFQDKYYEMDNTILDIYSENPEGTDHYTFNPNNSMGSGANEGSAFNREHLIPQSFFDEYRTTPMRNDAFHVWPTDSKVNGWRGNFSFGEVLNAENASPCNSGASNLPCKSKNGTLKGKYTASSSITVVEPIDEFKGDVARAFFYFITCYENFMYNFYNTTKSESKDMFAKINYNGNPNYITFDENFLNTLYTWHTMDPVSQREQDINDLIYYTHQNNRNPYIDHPEWVAKVWGLEDLSTDDFNYQERKDVTIYTDQAQQVVVKLENKNKTIERVTVYNMNGQIVNQTQNTSKASEVKVRINTKGIYIIKVEGKGMEINQKVVIK